MPWKQKTGMTGKTSNKYDRNVFLLFGNDDERNSKWDIYWPMKIIIPRKVSEEWFAWQLACEVPERSWETDSGSVGSGVACQVWPLWSPLALHGSTAPLHSSHWAELTFWPDTISWHSSVSDHCLLSQSLVFIGQWLIFSRSSEQWPVSSNNDVSTGTSWSCSHNRGGSQTQWSCSDSSPSSYKSSRKETG